MRRSWKKVAERADNLTCAPGEIGDWLVPALARDWQEGIPSVFVRSLDLTLNEITDFFEDHRIPKLESLRTSVAGHSFGNIFLDCAIKLVTEGEASSDLAVQAATNALAVRAARGAAQVEEHYLRKSSSPRAQRVRARIEQGIGGAALIDLARQLLKREPASVSRAPSKRRGLDDGVQL